MISIGPAEASSSSSFSSQSRYDVFLSFRGLDTRKTFTSHLHTALDKAGFRTFRDDEELEYGKDIKFELEKAITESKISLVVLSENYASSRWCLNELLEILQRKKAGGHFVVPIFYHVKPTDVRHLSGNFGEAFQRQGGKLKERKEATRKLEEWKFALQEVADFRGMDLEEDANGIESKFIQQIVQCVGEKVGYKMLAIDSNLVGINDRAKNIDSWLQDKATDVHIMIISGMGGIGKTTIAKFLYNNNFLKFQGSSFLENVREILKESQGLHRLQKQLFLDILKDERRTVYNTCEAIFELQNRLSCKKVLIIFDDVDEQDQLDKILGERHWLFGGSKIIITTRNDSLLSPLEAHTVTRIGALSPDESLKLFSWHVFGKTLPSASFNQISQIAVNCCGGHPLAIKVLASLLRQHGNHLDKWTDELSKLKKSPNEVIFTVLRTSYDSLGWHEKDLFIHIACLFVGKERYKVIKTLNWIGFHANAGIDILMSRCMLEEHLYLLQMHQLLQEMGKEIVCQAMLGQRCILWNHEDSFNVLRDKIGTDSIKSIVLDGSKLDNVIVDCPSKNSLFQEWLSNLGNSPLWHYFGTFLGSKHSTTTSMRDLYIVLETNVFVKMQYLSFLKLKCVQLHGNYENFPKRLRYLKWHGSPLQSIPSNFAMESIVVLNMKYSSLKYLWKGSKNLRSLEILNLKDSHSLEVTPNFSKVPKLKQLILENCTSLVELHESIGKLKDLIWLNLKNCKNLSKLPGSIGMLNSLDTLDVSGCSKLEGLPWELENMKSLQVLHANRIGEANAWKRKAYMFKLMLKPQKNTKITLASFPQSLTELNLQGCNLSDEDFPSNLSILISLNILNLSNNMISKPPDFIKCLPKLQFLDLESCPKLQFAFVRAYRLNVNNCTALKRIALAYESSYSHVDHVDCEDLVEIERCFKIEPIENVGAEILSNLGLYDLCDPETLQSTNVKLCKHWTRKAKKYPLQVYHTVESFCKHRTTGVLDLPESVFDQNRNWNTFSTWVPRSKLSFWFNNYLESNSTFIVPSHGNITNIQGLTVHIVYDTGLEWIDYLEYNQSNQYLNVLNMNTRLSWSVFNHVKGVPEINEDMICSTFVKMASDYVKGGDKLIVTEWNDYRYKVKEISVRLLYKEHEQGPTLVTIAHLESTFQTM